MKRYYSIPILLFLIGLIACQNNDPTMAEEEALNDKLMAVHDEVMPKMGEINSLRKKLINLSENASLNESDLSIVKENIEYLEAADEAMMDWMGTYKKPSKWRSEKSHEEIMAYLKTERVKIDQVKYDMLASINAAKELLKKHGSTD